LRWAERALGGDARVVGWRRMTGGIMSAVHRLTVMGGGHRHLMVLRQYEDGAARSAGLVWREADTLGQVHACGLAAPRLVAYSPDGANAGGHPSLLMTRLRGRVYLTPEDSRAWLGQIAAMAASIHGAPVAAQPLESRAYAVCAAVPESSARPRLWQAVIDVLRQNGGSPRPCFIHGDFQYFNFLWARGRLTGVVDWTMAAAGPSDLDVGHCRLNLAVLLGAGWAERFRLAYEAETGRRVDPWWDLYSIACYSDAWRRFIPIQVAGRAPVDVRGMTARVEDLLEMTLRRL